MKIEIWLYVFGLQKLINNYIKGDQKMSNILNQNGIAFMPIDKQISPERVAKLFCDMLQKGKTPSDIFENVNIDNVTRCYAAEYFGLADYNFSCHAQIVSKNEAEDFHSGNPSPDFYTSHDSIYAAKPANIGELALIHEKFFPEEYKLKELLSNGDLLPEPELDIEAVAFCSANTNDVEQCNITDNFYNKAYDQAEKAIMKYYENFWFQHSDIEIEFTDTQYYSVLIPVWKIDYSYSGQQFTCFVNGHSNSSTAILGHNNTYCGSFPEDGEKAKGLFGKLKAANDKRKYKDSQRSKYEIEIMHKICSFN